MLAVPTVDAENVDVHVAVPAVVPAASAHVVNVPVTPVTPRLTVPVGAVTGAVESVTVTVQVDPWFTATGVAQVTLVVVG